MKIKEKHKIYMNINENQLKNNKSKKTEQTNTWNNKTHNEQHMKTNILAIPPAKQSSTGRNRAQQDPALLKTKEKYINRAPVFTNDNIVYAAASAVEAWLSCDLYAFAASAVDVCFSRKLLRCAVLTFDYLA